MAKLALSGLGVCLVLLWTAALPGSDSDDLRQRAKAIQREAAGLAEKGRTEEAENLESKARELLETAERRDHEQRHAERSGRPIPQLEALEAHLKDLLTKEHEAREANAPDGELAELRQRIAATKEKLEALRSEQRRRPDAFDPGDAKPELNLETAAQRMHNLRMAAEHLRAAGALELSQNVTEQAEQMERDIHRAKEHLTRDSAEHDGGVPAQIEELRRETQRLRAEVEKLRRPTQER